MRNVESRKSRPNCDCALPIKAQQKTGKRGMSVSSSGNMGLNDANLRFYWEIPLLLSLEIAGRCPSSFRLPLLVHHSWAIPTNFQANCASQSPPFPFSPPYFTFILLAQRAITRSFLRALPRLFHPHWAHGKETLKPFTKNKTSFSQNKWTFGQKSTCFS